jgi:hypothetical protein
MAPGQQSDGFLRGSPEQTPNHKPPSQLIQMALSNTIGRMRSGTRTDRVATERTKSESKGCLMALSMKRRNKISVVADD